VVSREAGLDFEDHAWFAGFAPAEKPEIVVVALVENAGHGGEVAAPVVRKVMMQYFGVNEPLESTKIPVRNAAAAQRAARVSPSNSTVR
jgi:cell division protein FtsI/penicillin-binding protein 2